MSKQEILQKLPKIYDLKGPEKRNLLAFLQVNFFVENLREGKKQYLKNKAKDFMIQKLLNQFMKNLLHCHRLITAEL